MTREELEIRLEAKLKAGEITAEEAEHEWQEFVNPEPRFSGLEW